MADRKQYTACRLSPGITWIVRDRGVLVVDELARRSETLSYPEAAVWELLCRGHCLSRVVAMLIAILGVAEEEAQECTERCVHEWLEEGWMMATKCMDNQQP
jgi:hypothetical protein